MIFSCHSLQIVISIQWLHDPILQRSPSALLKALPNTECCFISYWIYSYSYMNRGLIAFLWKISQRSKFSVSDNIPNRLYSLSGWTCLFLFLMRVCNPLQDLTYCFIRKRSSIFICTFLFKHCAVMLTQYVKVISCFFRHISTYFGALCHTEWFV